MDTRPLLLLGLLAGCGLTTPDDCTSDQQCLDAFGWGHQCGDAGSCEVVEPTDACATAWPEDLFEDRAGYRDALVVGAMFDADLFPIERDAVHLAVDQVNDLGGIDGLPVAVVECDPAGAEGDAREALLSDALTLLHDGVGATVVLGPVQSSDARFVSELGAEVLLVSPGASAISLGAGSGSPVWRTAPSDADLSQSIVRDMIDEALAKAVVVHSREAGQAELADQLKVDLETAGFVGELFGYDSPTERDARVVDAAYANADAVVLLSESPDDYTDMLLGASAIEEYEGLVVYVGPAAYRKELLTEASAASALFPNVRGVRSATREGAVADVFRASFSSAFGGVDPDTASFAGQSYDSAWSAFSAMLWSGMRDGALTRDGVQAGMTHLSFGSPVSLGPSGWSDLVDAFGEARPVDLDGASSPLDFDATSQAIRGPIAVWVIQDGAFVTAREYVF